jgi:FtsP/CotA-like multicopper oxidase with cupredoxin domain
MDVIKVPTAYVTVARFKVSNHYGLPFPFDISGARYVWHCHILEH